MPGFLGERILPALNRMEARMGLHLCVLSYDIVELLFHGLNIAHLVAICCAGGGAHF